MIAILNCDVFPGLELNDPATSKSEDLVPDKYGSKWYEHQHEKKVFKLVDMQPDDEMAGIDDDVDT